MELPNDIQAERALLGCFLTDARLLDQNLVDPSDFFLLKHEYIYRALLAIHARNEDPSDEIVLYEQLQRTHPNAGFNYAFLADLINAAPYTYHFVEYAAIVRSTAKQRKVLDLSSNLAQSAMKGTPDETKRILEHLQALFAPAVASIADPTLEMSKYLIHVDDLINLPPQKWILAGEIPEKSITIVFGASGAGKSMYVLDRALRIAQTRSVVYVAAEGATGYPARVEAWKKHNHLPGGNMAFYLNVVSLLDRAELASWIKLVTPQFPDLVVIDTMSLCMLPGDENSTRDMGMFVKACKEIVNAIGCSVLLVHHTGKEGNKERGNSALRGAADVMIKVSAADDLIRIECSKTKDEKPFDPWYAKLITIDLPERGTTSAVLVKSDRVIQQKADPLSPNQKLIIDTLKESAFSAGASWSDLKNATGVPDGSLGRVLSNLIDKGLITGAGKPVEYTLTADGLKIES